MISNTSIDLKEMLREMDIAIEAEIKVQGGKSTEHIAIDGQLISEQNGLYLYTFTLKNPWEPQDDTPVKIKINNSNESEIEGTVVSSTGITIVIATQKPLSEEALIEIFLIDDFTQLLKRLREALKKNNEEQALLGSKTFRLLPFARGNQPLSVGFGQKFTPFDSQKKAIQMSLGSEVTFIVGPPGTGKTSTLAAIAFAHLREGKKVLIASHTNIAVDNAITNLVDVCNDTGAKQELEADLIIRYGTPQFDELIKEKYSCVHLPTIIRRQGSDLHEQRNNLNASHVDESAKLEKIKKELDKDTKQWKTKNEDLIKLKERDVAELRQLEANEQKRLSALDADFHQHNRLLNEYVQRSSSTNQQLQQMVAQITQMQSISSSLQKEIGTLKDKLTEAQQMNPLLHFLKGINVKVLVERLNDREQQNWENNQSLSKIQYEMDNARNVYAKLQEHVKYHQNKILAIQTEKNTPPPIEADRRSNLYREIEQIKKLLEQNDPGLQQKKAEIEQITNSLLALSEKLSTIDRQIADLEKNIVDRAQVIATTLSKTYMNQHLRERRFDVVIMDEVSMASLPMVYVAASRADRSVVVIGDPQQLAPICMAKDTESKRISVYEKNLATKWLGTELFTLREINLQKAAVGYDNSILLTEQSRMHPDISKIASKHVYQGLIKDKVRPNSTYSSVEPQKDKALVLCDTSDTSPSVIRPEGGSRINIYHALCTIDLARRALVTLPHPNDNLQPGEFRVGIVTPYRKQANLLQKLIKEAGLKDSVRAGTVHRFQGLQAEVIIFDTVESPPIDPRVDFIAGPLNTNAMRLVNVAVTRPKHKLIIVANLEQIKNKFRPDSILRLAVEEAERSSIVKSRDILSLPWEAQGEIARHILAPNNSRPNKESKADKAHPEYENLDELLKAHPEYKDFFKHLNENTFFTSLRDDILNSKKQIIIYSPFLALRRTKELVSLLDQKQQAGVKVSIITKPIGEYNFASAREAYALLKQNHIDLREEPKLHEKLVFIDDDLFYSGSLNVLSQYDSLEFMLRLKSQEVTKEVLRSFNKRKSV